MNSEAWQTRIVDLEAEIVTKEKRLEAIGSAKAAVITDHKRLMTLEQEENELPSHIEALTKRMPLLHHAREGALRAEAEERHQVLATQAEATAAAVTASTEKIRFAMRELLAQITEAHNSWEIQALLRAEAEYLQVRFALSPLQIPSGNRLAPEEQHGFVSKYALLLRHTATTQPWASLLGEWQESQRRADADKELAPGPRPNPYRHLTRTYA